MVEEEGFLGRWSRLKRTSQAETAPQTDRLDHPGAAADMAADTTTDTAAETAALPAEIPCGAAVPETEPPVLPPLDSLDADSDYTAFLKQGVPADLRRLALRKAWASDPKIAGFRGFGEYDWDYNAPGYGALRPTDDIKRLVDAIFPDEEPPPDGTPAPVEEPEEQPVAVAETEEDGAEDGAAGTPPA